MSLINDALKQARSAQPDVSPTADGPILRPDFSRRPPHIGSNLLLSGLIIIILFFAATLILQWFRSGGPAPIPVHARNIPDSQTQTSPSPQPASLAPVAPAPASIALEKTSASNAPVASAAQVVAPAPATNVPTVAVAPALPPPTYKLQSLFYRAKNPSAVINGKTVYIGDRVGEAHVLAIDKDSVTILTSKGETKVLDSPD